MAKILSVLKNNLAITELKSVACIIPLAEKYVISKGNCQASDFKFSYSKKRLLKDLTYSKLGACLHA